MVHAHYHTLAHSLFFLSDSFFLSKFLVFSVIFHPFSYFFSLLLTSKPYPPLPLTHSPPLLYWLGTNGWCLSLVCAPLPCQSKACLPFMRLPWLGGLSSLYCLFYHSFLISYGVDKLLGLRSLYLAFSLGWVLFGHRSFLLQSSPCLLCGLADTFAMSRRYFCHVII